MKFARNSFGENYLCKFDWGKDCFVQCGDEGIVISEESYLTAFFEVFSNQPKTFIRCEGNTIEEAEQKAWTQFQKYKKCKKHEFVRNGYTNGSGFCKHCGMFKSHAFEPTTKCKVCDIPTAYTCDVNNEWYCKEHKELIPDELLNEYQLKKRTEHRRMNITTLEDILALKDIDNNIIEFMKCLFEQENTSDISNIGKYCYVDSVIKLKRIIKRNNFVKVEEKLFDNKKYCCIIMEELDKDTKLSNGCFVKVFIPCNHVLLDILKVNK